MKQTQRLTPALAAAISGLLIAAFMVYTVVRARTLEMNGAGIQTQNFAHVLEEHARQTLRRVAGNLSQANAALGPVTLAGVLDAPQAHQLLQALLPTDRLIRNFLVLDRQGTLLLSTLQDHDMAFATGANRDYVTPHVGNADHGLVFGSPLKTPDGRWVLPVSQRIKTATESFDGILVAMVDIAFLQTFYDSINPGKDGLVALFLSSGFAVLATPSGQEIIGKNWSQAPLFQQRLPTQPAGTAHQVLVTDNIERIYSYRALNDYPVVVAYGLSVDTVLSSWRSSAWRDGLLLLLGLALLAGVAAKFKRQEAKRQVAERDLKNSELHLRSIIEAEPECIKIVDAQGRLLQMNAAGLGMIEADSFEQVQGQSVLDLVTPEYRAAFTDFHKRVLAGETVQLTFEMQGLKGGKRWLESHARPLKHQGQTVQLAITRDITERKQASRDLADSEQRFRTMIEWSPEAILVHRLGTILYVNPAAIKLFGANNAQELLTKKTHELIHPDAQAIQAARMKRLVDGADTLPLVESKFVKLDGQAILVEVQGTSVVYDGLPAIHVCIQDITERKQAEEALRIAAIAFESEQGMFITNAQRVILQVNKAFTQIMGYGAEDAVGQTPRMLQSGHHDETFYNHMMSSLQLTGGWTGEIWDKRKTGEVFPLWLSISTVKDDSGVVTHYVAAFTDISERKTAQAQIETLAFYDPLTQLPNRRLLMDRLSQAIHTSTRHARKSALLFVDLDNFKTLNDTLGHHQGDLLLMQVAQRLKTCIREGDTVARLGSDEFVVMLEDLSENVLDAANQIEMVGDKILQTLGQNYALFQGNYHSTPSIGVTLIGAEQAEDSEEPLKRAELAMFQAKAAGRNRLRFFDTQMQAEVSAHAALEVDLREAVQQQQFLLYYQAQVVGDGHLTGVEALIRWQHPQRGMVAPAQFIALAESSGLILPIGQWVLETACAQLAEWSKDPAMAHLTMAVNVSARQFQQIDFVDTVLATLARTQAKPKLLKLELTESMLVEDVEGIIAKMDVLKSKGVGFSLDDFGTGYSSLAYLKRLPLNQLKIDQGFVRNIVTDPNDAAIAKMVIALAESTGLAVIAEGVELQAQAEFLAHLGCHAYQGYLFSRPLPIVDFEAFAKKQPK
jgi:diguanylate cyclase (GGDEF)-like protein/PAS domain S-box-containing protein